MPTRLVTLWGGVSEGVSRDDWQVGESPPGEGLALNVAAPSIGWEMGWDEREEEKASRSAHSF